MGALVEELAGVGGHGLWFGEATERAGKLRVEDGVALAMDGMGGHGGLLSDCGGEASVGCGLGESLGLSFVWVVGDGGGFVGVVDLNGGDAGDLLEGFFDGDWTEVAGHVFDVEGNGFGGSGKCREGECE